MNQEAPKDIPDAGHHEEHGDPAELEKKIKADKANHAEKERDAEKKDKEDIDKVHHDLHKNDEDHHEHGHDAHSHGHGHDHGPKKPKTRAGGVWSATKKIGIYGVGGVAGGFFAGSFFVIKNWFKHLFDMKGGGGGGHKSESHGHGGGGHGGGGGHH